jgi:nitrite reductase (NO-forming)
MKATESGKRGMSSVQVLSIFLIVTLAASAVVYMDSTQALNSEILNLQSQLNALQKGRSQSQNATSQNAAQTQPSVSEQVTPTVRHLALVAREEKVQIATNVTYDAWTFNGTVPGPTIMVNQGDTINFKLINDDTSMSHSIDFHAAEVDWSTDYATVPPGQSKTFSFTVNYPGVFMYHCGTPPVLEHIGNGMYGAIIVNPITPLSPAPGGQYVLVQSEFYLNAHTGADGAYAGNYTKMLAATPDYVVFNGKANQYQKAPLSVLPNQLVRLYILNVGPSHWSAFHVIGALMDTVYIDGNPANVEHGLQTLNIPPSGGAIVEMYFRDPGGMNPFVTHDFSDASKGAVGLFAVGSATATSVTTSSSQSAQSVPAGASVQVSILSGSATGSSSTGYSPDTITVVIGVNNTVVWTNNDSSPHTVTALDKSFDSGNMNAGDSFTHTFTTAGVYQYGCAYHPWMKGTVIVKA